MRRFSTICSLALLFAAVIYACSSTIDPVATSLVRVEVGRDRVASVRITPATLWAKAGLLLGKAWNTQAAQAAIPSIVDSMRLSVTGSGMPAMTAVVAVAGSDTVSFVVEVPNGQARLFTVEGMRGGVTTWYRGEASADLAGAPVTLTVRMSFVGPGIIVSTTGVNTAGCGTNQPCLTIANGITEAQTQGKSIVAVMAGQYPTGATISLNLPGMTLLCLGSNHTTEILPPTGGATIQGSAPGTTVDGCKLNLIGATISPAIDDNGSSMTVNNVLVVGDALNQIQGSIILSGNSIVRNSTIQNNLYSLAAGIQINGGSPMITNNMIEGNTIGILVSATGTFPVITNNIIKNNLNGLEFSLAANGFIGPVRDNSIFCNTGYDLYSNINGIIDVSSNSWDHDDATIDSWVAISPTPCSIGVHDICSWQSTGTVTYHPTNAPVPGGCP